MHVYENVSADLDADELYDLVQDRELRLDNSHQGWISNGHRNHDHDGHDNDKHKKQPCNWRNLAWNVVLILVFVALLYLTFSRYRLAASSIYKGNNFSGLAMLSPEIGSIVTMGLGI